MAEENAATARPPGAQEYQCAFDTVAGRWSEVLVRFKDFIPVCGKAAEDPDAPPLDTRDIRAVGLTLSKLDFNGHPNPVRPHRKQSSS